MTATSLWSAAATLPRIPARPHDVPAFAIDLAAWMASGDARGQLENAYDTPGLPETGWVDNEAPHVTRADLYYAAPEMCALVAAHAGSFPGSAHAPQPVTQHGLLVLGEPLTLWPGAADRLAGLYWHRGATTMLLAQEPHLDRLLTLSPKIRLDSSPEERRDWPAGTRAAWHVIATVHAMISERVTVVSDVHLDRAARRRLQRQGLDDIPPVRLVELRRPTVSATASVTPASVDWQCRWVVSPHWRQQFMPSTGRHEARFIEAHVKGPADRPLVVRETVNYWRR